MRSVSVSVVVLVLAGAVLAAARLADGAGPCGASPPDQVALKLAPCVSAAKDPDSTPSQRCCAAVKDIGEKSAECLCAVLLSKTVRQIGVKPEMAITIPKRCNIANRPIGYKCGDFTLPNLQLQG
ncbi:uncharacterized protein [Lolium perenne]|uniref:uncharacterized protein n=1 Tax=Lolium perenne TaxID=4522 RepID=UPI0021EB23E5|nr:non-specific lipid-transfer protein C, cotyledon-specific isoform-like [Lolium perenne]